MPDRSGKRPRDINELGKWLVDRATSDEKPPDPDEGKDPAAVALGRKGGLRGGKARAQAAIAATNGRKPIPESEKTDVECAEPATPRGNEQKGA